MATVHLTLEEAAQRLGVTPDEFKRRLKTDPAFKILVPIRDGATLRFKANAVDELARQLGAASDPGLLLAPLPEKGELDSDDFHVPTLLHPSASSASEVSGDDIFSISSEEVRPDKPKGKPDSDVRLEASDRKSAGVEDKNTAVPTEEIDLDVASPPSAIIRGASASKLVPPSPSSSKIVATEAAAGLSSDSDSSEFELSLDSDSDDFQLSLNAEAGDEVKIGEEAPASPARGASGINLRQPADSGISLEKKDDAQLPVSQDKPSDEELDFELTLDSNTAASGIKLSGLTSRPAMTTDSDSEFELTLDDSSGTGASMEHAVLEELGNLVEGEEKEQTRGDIFETDFEVPPLESGSASEAVALETDTDLAEGDLSSDVVVEESTEEALPEAQVEEVDLAQVDLEEGPSASQALRGVPTVYPEEELVSAAAAQYQPVPWGPLPAILLLLAFPFMFLGVLMGYQTVETMVGYQQPQKPVAPLLRSIASTLDMELKDQ